MPTVTDRSIGAMSVDMNDIIA